MYTYFQPRISIKQEEADIKEMIDEVVDRFYNMIWCQQANSFNFDKLNKAEQIPLIGMYKDAVQLKSDLLMYKSFFKK